MSARSKLRRKARREFERLTEKLADRVQSAVEPTHILPNGYIWRGEMVAEMPLPDNLIGNISRQQKTRHGMVVRCDPETVPVEMIRDFKIRGRLSDPGRTARRKFYGIETPSRKRKERAKQESVLKEKDAERTYKITISLNGNISEHTVIANGSDYAAGIIRRMNPGCTIEAVE